MTNDKTVTVARELAQRIFDWCDGSYGGRIINEMEELRAVLAQEAGPVVEPVAWQLDVEGYTTVTYDNYQKVLAEQEHFRGRGRTAVIRNLFTSPPAPVAPEEPIAYMRNEGKPNNLVKCTFACPGAFGVYAHSSKDTDRLDWIERHDPDIRSDIDTDMEQNHWPTS